MVELLHWSTVHRREGRSVPPVLGDAGTHSIVVLRPADVSSEKKRAQNTEHRRLLQLARWRFGAVQDELGSESESREFATVPVRYSSTASLRGFSGCVREKSGLQLQGQCLVEVTRKDGDSTRLRSSSAGQGCVCVDALREWIHPQAASLTVIDSLILSVNKSE